MSHIISYAESEEIDVGQGAHADDSPKTDALQQGTQTYSTEDIARKGGSDKEEGDGKGLAGKGVDGIAYLNSGLGGAQKVGVDQHGQKEEEDEPGNADFLVLGLEDDGGDKSQGDNPKGTGELDSCGNAQSFFAICLTGSYYGASVVDGDGSPGTEFLLGHIESMAYDGGRGRGRQH